MIEMKARKSEDIRIETCIIKAATSENTLVTNTSVYKKLN